MITTIVKLYIITYISLVLLLLPASTEVLVNTSSGFPHQIEKPFLFIVKTEETVKENELFLVIRDCYEKEQWRYHILLSQLEYPINLVGSKFIKSLQVTNTTYDNQVSIEVMFQRNAHKQTLELNRVKRLEFNNNKTRLGKLIYHRVIDLIVSPEIRMTTKNWFDLNNDQFVTITCNSIGGIPSRVPNFIGLDKFNLAGEKYWSDGKTGDKNIGEVVLNVTEIDDREVIQCGSGINIESVKSILVRVMYHPKDLSITPEFNFSLTSNTKLTCQNVKGYPNPNITWSVVIGPEYYNQYYQIDGNESSNIFQFKEAPEWSFWKLRCSVKSVVNKDVQNLEQFVKFIIKSSTNKDKTSSSVTKDEFTMVSYLEKQIVKLRDEAVKNYKIVNVEINSRLNKLKIQFDKQVNQLKKLYSCNGGQVYYNYCYKRYSEKKSFDNAQSTCSHNNGNLVWFENSDEANFLNSILKDYRNVYFWIGYKNDKWIYGNSTYNLVLSRNYHSYSTSYSCVVTYSINYNRVHCHSRYNFICKFPKLKFEK